MSNFNAERNITIWSLSNSSHSKVFCLFYLPHDWYFTYCGNTHHFKPLVLSILILPDSLMVCSSLGVLLDVIKRKLTPWDSRTTLSWHQKHENQSNQQRYATVCTHLTLQITQPPNCFLWNFNDGLWLTQPWIIEWGKDLLFCSIMNPTETVKCLNSEAVRTKRV